MKRLVCIALLFALLALPACAEIDLTGLSFAELVELQGRLNLAIWNCQEWQEVTIPQGLWEVGVDIPAGHWTITAADGAWATVAWGDRLNRRNSGIDNTWNGSFYELVILTSPSFSGYDEGSDRASVSWQLKSGQFIEIDSGSAVFTPYTGKPSLGFK